MAIKSKNTWIKLIAILLCLLSTRGIGVQLISIVDENFLTSEPFESSSYYYEQIGAYYNQVYQTFYKAPGTVDAEALKGLNEQSQFLYAIEQTNPSRQYSNLPGASSIQALYPFSHVVVRLNSQSGSELPEYQYCDPKPPQHTEIAIALTAEQYIKLERYFYNSRENPNQVNAINQHLFSIFSYSASLVLGIALLLYAATRRNKQQEVPMPFWNRPFLDFSALATTGLITICAFFVIVSYEELHEVNRDLMVFFIASSMIIALLLGLNWLMSLSRRIARKEFVRSTFIGWMLLKVLHLLRRLIQGLSAGPLVLQTLMFFVGVLLGNLFLGLGILLMISVTGIVILAIPALLFILGGFNLVALLFLMDKAIAIEQIDKGTSAILAGDLSKPIPIRGGQRLSNIALKINELSQGFHNAIDKALKSERLKTELLTNVSHDLKTPLTSIITYVDLLKLEGLSSENGPHYLDIIDQKSQRLKSLTTDLFDAAKANTGNLQVNLEPLDLVSLLRQGLGELSSQIEASTLTFKTDVPERPFTILADGKHLWRIIENLLSNTLKYTLQNTRVYLDITLTESTAVLTLKNISATPLNLSPEALMERFVREDTARTSEGSGLGLAIAKDLATLQGGTLDIDIDGDLFKARLTMPLAESLSDSKQPSTY